MRIFLLGLVVVVSALSLGGCAATLDEEERDFFYSSWMKNP